MTAPSRREPIPAECLDLLPAPVLEITGEAHDEDLRRIELRRAVLAIAELDHVGESTLVRSVAAAVLGDVPDTDDGGARADED